MHGQPYSMLNNGYCALPILWNDGRRARVHFAGSERSAITSDTGNLMMPGFTAPKLLWVQRHEPEIFRQIDKVLLPKDYLRLRMTGEFASDMSDAAGTCGWMSQSVTGVTSCCGLRLIS
ncbi:FGGY family carbohydrate kinase [Shigella flexneri]